MRKSFFFFTLLFYFILFSPLFCEIPSPFYTQKYLFLPFQLLGDQANQIHFSPLFFLTLLVPLSFWFFTTNLNNILGFLHVYPLVFEFYFFYFFLDFFMGSKVGNNKKNKFNPRISRKIC